MVSRDAHTTNAKVGEVGKRQRQKTIADAHSDVDVERMVAYLSSHVHVALAIFLHAGVGIGGKMKIVALQRACKIP